MKQQTEATLSYIIELDKGNMAVLSFLVTNYVKYLEHRLKQILE
ncbi:hypothetical protein [Kordia sp.]|nr:hypothetical protein [Kordia sp.]